MLTKPILAFGSALALAGCGASVASLQADISASIAKIQVAALAVCQVVPTAESIDQLILVGDPALTTVNAVASAICKAVEAAPAPAAGPLNAAARQPGVLYGKIRPAPVSVDGVSISFQ